MQFINLADKFRAKMLEFSGPSSTNMIFTEDLKNMIHLAEATSDDLDLVYKMITRCVETSSSFLINRQ
jgi:pentatricopeptide repeat domain-containing protein 2